MKLINGVATLCLINFKLIKNFEKHEKFGCTSCFLFSINYWKESFLCNLKSKQNREKKNNEERILKLKFKEIWNIDVQSLKITQLLANNFRLLLELNGKLFNYLIIQI